MPRSPMMPSFGSSTSPFPVSSKDTFLSATSSTACDETTGRYVNRTGLGAEVRSRLGASAAARAARPPPNASRSPGCSSSLRSSLSRRVKASAVEPAKPTMMPSPIRLTFLAFGFAGRRRACKRQPRRSALSRRRQRWPRRAAALAPKRDRTFITRFPRETWPSPIIACEIPRTQTPSARPALEDPLGVPLSRPCARTGWSCHAAGVGGRPGQSAKTVATPAPRAYHRHGTRARSDPRRQRAMPRESRRQRGERAVRRESRR